MKTSLLLLALLFSFKCFSQTLELKISTPQPRLGETFNLNLAADTITSNLFGFLSKDFKVSSYFGISSEVSTLGANLQAKKLGHNEIGPLTLKINNKIYTTNKITFDVVDSLPLVNKGLWIRTVPLDDSTSYILIEQRIPASTYITHNSPNSTTSTDKINDDDKEIEMIQDNEKINFRGSHSTYQSITDPKKNEELKFEY